MKKKLTISLFVLFIANGMAIGNPFKNENIFKHLKKDVPNPSEAILAFTVKTFNKNYNVSSGDVLFSFGSMVYSCPLNLKSVTKTKKDGGIVTEATYIYSVQPGTFDLNAVEIETVNGQFSSSTRFPFHGSFRLEAGTINYLGEINIDITSSISNLAISDERYKDMTEKFKKDYPAIISSVKGNINAIQLADSYPCETDKPLFNEDFSNNSRDWKVKDEGVHKMFLSDGSFVIDNQGTDSCLVTSNVEIPESFDIELETTWQGGNNNKRFGLLIGTTEKLCFQFTITGNGYCSIWEWMIGKPLFSKIERNLAKDDGKDIVYSWAKTDALRTNPGDKNIIRVQKTAWYMHTVGMIAFYINNKLIARNIYYLGAIQFSKKGVVGMFSYGKQTVSFDNLKLSTLK